MFSVHTTPGNVKTQQAPVIFDLFEENLGRQIT